VVSGLSEMLLAFYSCTITWRSDEFKALYHV